MAWDTEATRNRLLQAATSEFVEHGPSGATMAAIAARARLNKERLYAYFGDKDALFAVVLERELSRLAESVVPPAGGLEDIGEFAARTYDYYSENPGLARLLLWEGLAGGPPVNEAGRAAHYREKAAAYAAAQHAGTMAGELDSAHLVFLVIGIAAWWFCVPQLARMATGADNDEPAERVRRRDTVVRAAQLLAAPGNKVRS